MVIGGNGQRHNALLEEFEVGKRVHNRVAPEQILHNRLSRLVGLQLHLVGLVRDVEIAALVVAARLHVREELGQECAQEGAVFLARCIGFPAKDLLIFAVHGRHDLGRVLGTPLGEQVRDLKILNAHAVAHVDPAPQLIKAKGIGIAVLGHVHQLHRGALKADGGIQRRGEHGGQQQIDAVLACRARKILHDSPMLLAPGGYMVVVCKAIAMEPLGQAHGLRGQGSTDDGDVNVLLLDDIALAVGQRDIGGVRAGRERAVRVKFDPNAA